MKTAGQTCGNPLIRLVLARLAYVDVNGKAVLEALGHHPENSPLDENFLKKYCGKVTEGIDRICNWLTD